MKHLKFVSFVAILAGALMLLLSACQKSGQPAAAQFQTPWQIPVVVVKYFPVDENNNIDLAVTGDWGQSLEFTRKKADSLSNGIVEFMNQASRYHFYKNPRAEPSLNYQILQTYEFLEPLPTFEKPGHGVPMTDYNAIVQRIDVRDWVENKGVKEVWIWGYHGGVIDLWESNMAGPHGDVSNSDRDEADLPMLGKTYTVYHYNYQRSLKEAIENHMHQIEALLNHVDGRDEAPRKDWPKLLFWGRFVGSDSTHKIVGDPHCGWAHYTPNSEKDYDWANPRYVTSDIEDWKPDWSGERKEMNCERWNCNSLDWFTLWMQSLPGKDNGLSYQGKPLTDWWVFVGDWDLAKMQNLKLVEGDYQF